MNTTEKVLWLLMGAILAMGLAAIAAEIYTMKFESIPQRFECPRSGWYQPGHHQKRFWM